jgi:hypothetical protein
MCLVAQAAPRRLQHAQAALLRQLVAIRWLYLLPS